MQYTLTINQVKAVEWGLNATQSALMAFIYELESWGRDVIQGPNAYKWISKQKVVDDLPLYFSKTDTVHRGLISLEKKGLVTRNFTSKRSLIKLTSKGKEWRIGEKISPLEAENQSKGRSEIIPSEVGSKSAVRSDLDPTDPSTIDPSNKDLKEKNIKKEVLDFSPLGLTDEQVNEFKRLRKHTKAMITQRVINTIGKELELTRQAGYSNDDILNVWLSKSWRSYEHQWFIYAMQQSTGAHHEANPRHITRRLSAVERQHARIREKYGASFADFEKATCGLAMGENDGDLRRTVEPGEWGNTIIDVDPSP
jgi:hypothetical protein